MGTAQIVLNRYLYFLRSPRQNGENMWRCVNYKRERCRAYIIVKNCKVLKRSVKNELSSRGVKILVPHYLHGTHSTMSKY